ncbi:MAG: hypothetical protein WCU88_10845 [Elusimicrobiota bacterium]|jgi:hypothetical protein
MKRKTAVLLLLLSLLASRPPARGEVVLENQESLAAAGRMQEQSLEALSSGPEQAWALAGASPDGASLSGVFADGSVRDKSLMLAAASDSPAEKAKPSSGIGKKIGKGAVVAGAGTISGLLGAGKEGLLGGLVWGALGLGAAYLMMKGDYGGAIGTGVGGVVGEILGGPLGGIIGGIVGGIIGHFIGKMFSDPEKTDPAKTGTPS